MAVGRKQVEATSGNFGRVSAPPEGGMFVRDPEAAEAKAIRERAAAFEAAGEKIPKHLQKMLDSISVGKDASDIKLVDALTGEELGKVKHVDTQARDAAGTPPPPARPPEELKKGEEPEFPLPDAEQGLTEADVADSPEDVRPMPGPAPLPEGVPPLPDQEQPVLAEIQDAAAEAAAEAEKQQEEKAPAKKAAARKAPVRGK